MTLNRRSYRPHISSPLEARVEEDLKEDGFGLYCFFCLLDFSGVCRSMFVPSLNFISVVGRDSMEVERNILGSSKALPGNAIVEDIRNMLSREWSVIVRRVLRETNKMIAALATLPRDQPHEVLLFDTPPTFIVSLVITDQHGNSSDMVDV
ncbi:hypothetical protein V6N12_049676 [Hibiscus sabdariffa]|uniref:RNase H type-1 domain-containing protein n=1 Tax=Hibiscus sabdariffa TaxID=183260 RepID=A0ABR2GA82_9ROSI